MTLRDDNDSSWRGRLVRANWRGFEFLTESYEARGGHRLVVHEFPGSDVPVVENLGLKAGGHKLNAYFLGDDYDRERNQFLKRLNEKGAAWLNHPWLGQQWLQVHDWSLHESSDKGGYCVVAVDFAAGGREPYTPMVDAVDTAFGAVAMLRDAVVLRQLPLSISALDAFKQRIFAALNQLQKMIALAQLPLKWAGEAFDLIAQIKGSLNELLAIPGAYLNALRSLSNVLGTLGVSALGVGTSGVGTSGVGALGIGASRVGTQGVGALSVGTVGFASLPQYAKASDTSGAITDAQRLRSISVLAKLAMPDTASAIISSTNAGSVLSVAGAIELRQAATEEQLARSQLWLASTAEVALSDYTSAGARDAALNLVLGSIDAHLPLATDTLFEALANVRASLIAALQVQQVTTTPAKDIVHMMPATALAYLMDFDEQSFLETNLVRHPLFVQGRVYGE